MGREGEAEPSPLRGEERNVLAYRDVQDARGKGVMSTFTSRSSLNRPSPNQGEGPKVHWVVAAWRGNLFAVPVLYRLMFANLAVLIIGALLGTALASGLRGSNRSPILVGFVITGLLLSIVVNFVLIKIAFLPLTRLRETMRRVEAGDMTLRAPITGFDPDADDLAATFNHMLGRLDDLAKSRAQQILRAQEEERKRIARELHDETSQALTTLLISLAMAEQAIQDDATRARVNQVRELAHQTLRAVRNLSIDLRPSALDDHGLLPAVRWYVKEYQQRSATPVEFISHGFKDRYATEVETAIYRIVQEALTNVARHAHATNVHVELMQEGDIAHARIHDNGHGFDAPALMRQPIADRGLGLMGMYERATLLDGTLEVISSANQGTTIDARIPLLPARQEESDGRYQ